jgi:hypothetical protein
MATRELCDKYGGNQKMAINRAIRAEIAHGGAILDAMTAYAGLLHRCGGRINEEVYNALATAADAMEAEIRRRYEMPPLKG